MVLSNLKAGWICCKNSTDQGLRGKTLEDWLNGSMTLLMINPMEERTGNCYHHSKWTKSYDT